MAEVGHRDRHRRRPEGVGHLLRLLPLEVGEIEGGETGSAKQAAAHTEWAFVSYNVPTLDRIAELTGTPVRALLSVKSSG